MEPLSPEDPPRIGRYILLGRLGAGGMGRVYLGRSPGRRLVAIKVIRPDLAEDPGFRARFRREVTAARAVGGFWTAAVLDADPDAPAPWLATEYIPGPSLAQAITIAGPLPADTVHLLAAGLAEALVAIHATGLIHRDLKPSNVLLAADGPRVIDFGICRAMEGSELTQTGLTQTGTTLGTPGYLSPEQALGHTLGPPSDVFSLGALLVFAASSRAPFGEGPTPTLLYRVVHTDPDLDAVPDALRALITWCLAKDPAARPAPERILAELGDDTLAATGVLPQDWLPPTLTGLIATYTVSTPPPPASAMVKPRRAPQPTRTPPPGRSPTRTRKATAPQPAVPGPTRSSPQDPIMPPSPTTDKWPPVLGVRARERISANPPTPKQDNRPSVSVAPKEVSAASGRHDQQRRPRRRGPALGILTVVIGLMFLSHSRSQTHLVPPLACLTRQEALQRLNSAGLHLGQEHPENSRITAGKLIKSDPPAGQQVTADTPVDIWISQGSADASVPDGTARVPYVIGATQAGAEQGLAVAGLAVGQTHHEPNQDVDKGRVFKTDPPAGQRVTADTTVDIWISQGWVPGDPVPPHVALPPRPSAPPAPALGSYAC